MYFLKDLQLVLGVWVNKDLYLFIVSQEEYNNQYIKFVEADGSGNIFKNYVLIFSTTQCFLYESLLKCLYLILSHEVSSYLRKVLHALLREENYDSMSIIRFLIHTPFWDYIKYNFIR